MAGMALCAGIITVRMTRGTRLDRMSAIATRWWGIGVPMVSRRRSLAGLQTVRLRRFEVRTRKGFSVRYFLRLEGTAPPLELMQTRSAGLAHDWAGRVSRYLRLPLEDLASEQRASSTEASR